MATNPKPKKGAYARRRKREKKSASWIKAYGHGSYVEAIHAQGCIVQRFSPVMGYLSRCVYPMEAAHVVKKTRYGDPLATWRGLFCCCRQHHGEQEGGTDAFELRYDIVGVTRREAARCVELFGYLVTDAGADD